MSKCKFAQREIAYLGHVISERGLSTDPAKIQAISSWLVPSNVRALQGFLGLASRLLLQVYSSLWADCEAVD